jgi:hypothetical protein
MCRVGRSCPGAPRGAPLAGGWGSGIVLGAGLGGLAVLAIFVGWEHPTANPMLNLDFFRSRRFSTAVATCSLNMFALFGVMFVLTQFLQFKLEYDALAAGVRVLPVAAVLCAAAPCSALLVRIMSTLLGSIGGALEVAARVGGGLGTAIGTLARSAFMSGMHLGLLVAAVVAAAAVVLTLVALPSRGPAGGVADDESGSERVGAAGDGGLGGDLG